jgi:HSP20 family protein
MDIFDEIRRIQEEMDRMFSSIYTKPSLPSKGIKPFNYREPLLDVVDGGKELVIQAELPGVNKDDIEIDINEDALTIKASKRN